MKVISALLGKTDLDHESLLCLQTRSEEKHHMYPIGVNYSSSEIPLSTAHIMVASLHKITPASVLIKMPHLYYQVTSAKPTGESKFING
jgi:hypothetical protein